MMYNEPFVVGMYHGMSKPNNANEYLRPFVEEASMLLQNRLTISGQICRVVINAILCDAPAKSFIIYTKSHTGYFACSKSIQERDFVCNRIIYPEVNSLLRTDESFRQRTQPKHHTGTSILENLNIDVVSQIPLDYMHLCCLGSRRLCQFWIRGSKDVRLTIERLNALNEFIISEFARKPRSLIYIDKWKATEMRLFIFYIGPVILKFFLPETFYNHLLALSIALRILADVELCYKLNNYAHLLLVWFASKYGMNPNISLSKHIYNLVHLANDVKTFGCLDFFFFFFPGL